MKQLTLRGFDEELAARLERLASERSISLNRAALLLMRRGAGLGASEADLPVETAIGSALDKFIGVWTQAEERDFLQSIEGLDQIDPELWE